MPKYRVTMTKNGSTDVVVVYVEKINAKVAYDDAVIGATFIFGPSDLGKSHIVSIVEEPVV